MSKYNLPRPSENILIYTIVVKNCINCEAYEEYADHMSPDKRGILRVCLLIMVSIAAVVAFPYAIANAVINPATRGWALLIVLVMALVVIAGWFAWVPKAIYFMFTALYKATQPQDPVTRIIGAIASVMFGLLLIILIGGPFGMFQPFWVNFGGFLLALILIVLLGYIARYRRNMLRQTRRTFDTWERNDRRKKVWYRWNSEKRSAKEAPNMISSDEKSSSKEYATLSEAYSRYANSEITEAAFRKELEALANKLKAKIDQCSDSKERARCESVLSMVRNYQRSFGWSADDDKPDYIR